MNYDDYKLATPPDFDNETVYEYCDDCDKKFESDELNNVLIDLVPFTLCKNCKNKAENLNPKNPKIMKTAKERFEAIKIVIDNDMIPEGCEMRLWVNKCTRKELLDLGAELEILCEKRSDLNSSIHLYIEYKGHDIYLWE